MKKLIYAIPAFLIIFILVSCSSTKKASEPQVSNAPAETKVVAEPQKSDESKTAATLSTDEKSGANEKITGSEIIRSYMSRLKTKLELKENQISSVENILTKTFTDSGEKLDNVYDAAQAKALGKSTVVKAADPIMAILDDNQKATFSKFIKQ